MREAVYRSSKPANNSQPFSSLQVWSASDNYSLLSQATNSQLLTGMMDGDRLRVFARMPASLHPAHYFDYSATTPPRPEAIAAVSASMTSEWGNPSSLHSWGQRAALVLERSRQQVAALIGADAESIVFVSGGTEADNLALMGIAGQFDCPQHMAISSVEHSAIENTARRLEAMGWDVSRIPVTSEGIVTPSALRCVLRPHTALVSVVHGQSEVGTIQPIAQLASICREAGVLFHSDGVQTAGRSLLSATDLGVDLYSLSSHKLYGPQGAGALYIRPGLKLSPYALGGKQEKGWRAGTQALPAIAGFGIAAELARQELARESQHLRKLQSRLAKRLAQIDELSLTGPQQLSNRLPHHLSYWSPMSGTDLVTNLYRQGFAISSGSACNSGQLVPSRVLVAMGYSDRQALGGIRITLGKFTTVESVDQLARAIAQTVASQSIPAL